MVKYLRTCNDKAESTAGPWSVGLGQSVFVLVRRALDQLAIAQARAGHGRFFHAGGFEPLADPLGQRLSHSSARALGASD